MNTLKIDVIFLFKTRKYWYSTFNWNGTPNALDNEVLETTPLDPNLALATCVFLELF